MYWTKYRLTRNFVHTQKIKHLQLASFMNLFLKPVHNEKVCDV